MCSFLYYRSLATCTRCRLIYYTLNIYIIINLVFQVGDSAISLASNKGHDKVVQILINAGANKNAQPVVCLHVQ